MAANRQLSLLFSGIEWLRMVPVHAGIFKEPITVATGYWGNNTNAAGVCIKPPPPTIASTKPAEKAKRQSKISVNVVIGLQDSAAVN
jgi:hypothetical protein